MKEENFGSFTAIPSDEQLKVYFQLTDTDYEVIREMRLPATRLGFAIQLTSVRFLGTFPDLKKVPDAVVVYVARQLNIDPIEFSGYSRKMTISQHSQIIKSRYDYQTFNDQNTYQKLNEWITARATYTIETEEMLSDMLLQKCLDERILLPGISVFQRFVTTAIEAAEKQLDERLSAVPSVEVAAQLLDLVELHGDSIQDYSMKMDLLRSSLVDDSKKEIERGFNRVKAFQQFNPENWILSDIPEGKLKNYAQYAFKAKANLIQRMNRSKKLALLVAFVYEYQKIAIDELLTALVNYYDKILKRAKNKESKERLRTIKDLDRAALTLSEIGTIILDESIEPNEIREFIFHEYSQQNISDAVSQVKKLARNDQTPIAISELLQSYRKFRLFIPQIINTLDLEIGNYGQDFNKIWTLLSQQYPRPISFNMFTKVEEAIPKKWRFYIRENPHEVNKCMIILSVEAFVRSLNKHDVFVPNSKKFIDPMSTLLDEKSWEQQKEILLNQLKLSENPDVSVQQLKDELSLSYEETIKNWSHSEMARIEQQENADRIIVSNIRKAREPKEEQLFKERIRELIPAIDLPDLLLEVNQQVNLTSHFQHTNDSTVRMEELDVSILAVLLAEACNIGFSPVSREGIDSLKYDRLMYVDHQYIRLDTLAAANKAIISPHKESAATFLWGDNQMASADGIRYIVPKRSLHARHNPKYFGRGRGITFYNFVSDQYIGFHGIVVPGTLRDSLYLLDGFLNHQSGLEPKQIMTDTAGYSDLVFGLFGLLGFQFSPRIANNHGTKLWRIDTHANYRMLNNVSKNKINIERIKSNWPELLRVAGSLKSGKVNSVELIKSLQRNGQPTELGKGIIEYGKIFKTKHQLRYISDESYARQILEQLNKGESRHALCRNIFYGKKGKLYQSYIDGMEEQLSALGLVTNAVIYWNTRYLIKIIDRMKLEGYDCSDEMIEKLSPLMHEHINFVGKYSFKYDPTLNDGRMRPLNIQTIEDR